MSEILEIVQFENGRYGLRNVWTDIIVDREWRTIWGANRARNKRATKLSRAFKKLGRV